MIRNQPTPISASDARPVVHHANYMDVRQPQAWGPRTIDDIELILIVRGPFEYVDPAGRIELASGQLLLIPPEVRHTFSRPTGEGRWTFSCLHCELLPDARWARGDYRLDVPPRRVTDVNQDVVLRDLFRHVAREFAGRGQPISPIAEALARAIWVRLSDHWTGRRGPVLSPRMQAMTDFLRRRMADPVSRRDLAERFDLTPQHVNHLFRTELDTTPTAWLNHQRCLQARQLMKVDGLNCRQAARAVGFADPYYFSKVYKRIMGTPPSRG
ncbi:MAG: helix-turn-helix domain-containing protein [Bacteroidetes bacterium]|jgi:AraC-like DNA-binding protein|nr:helix-turn-helix domain-containing protein [Bacteroidota bacterium]